ncbi:MAG: DUF835 domain-containing protein [Candidatus Thermoplasmatota archaeon]|nr:DUF835 domain-containing protein [Candidatus Thermoplasmatota archaeon]
MRIPVDTASTRKLVLFNEIKPSMSFEAFREHVAHGDSGLCITRRSTSQIVSAYDLDDVEYRNLDSEGHTDAINPDDLDKIVDVIEAFAAENENPAFLIDGFDFLIAINSVDEVTEFLKSVRDTLEGHGGRLMVSINLDTLDNKDSTRIARCFDEVEGL